MKFETNNLVIIDNPDLNNLIVPVGFFLKNDDNGNDNDNDNNNNMNLLNYVIKNSSVIDDNLYDKLFNLVNLVDNNKFNNKTKKTSIKKNKTKKNIKKNKNKKTKRHIKLK